MKRIMTIILMAAGTAVYSNGNVFGIHTILRNASNITQGDLDPARVNPATFTLLGPTIEASETGTGELLYNAVSVVFSTHIAPNTITGADIAAETIESGDIADGTIVGADIAQTTIGGGHIATGGVFFSSHINTGAGSLHAATATLTLIGGNTNYRSVNSLIFASNTVRGTSAGGLLSDSASIIFSTHIAPDTITGADIAPGEVGTSELEDSSVNSDKILNATIQAEDVLRGVANGFIEVAGEVVKSSHIAPSAIGRHHIVASTITNVEILDGTIISDDIGNSQIIATKIAGDAIISSKILDDTILSADIKDATIVNSDVSRGQVSGIVEIGPGVVFSSMASGNWTSISSFSVTGSSLVFNSQTSTGAIVFQSSAPMANGIWRVQNGVTFVGGDLDTTGGGGGGGIIGSTVGIKPFQIVVGTLGAQNVDIASSTVDGLNEALSKIGARGLTNSATAAGIIFYKEGFYPIAGATIPAGVVIYAIPGSSTVWGNTGVGKETIVNIYGKVDGITFSGSEIPIDTEMIKLSSGARLQNFRILDSKNLTNPARLTCILCVRNSSDVVISNGEIRGYSGRQGFAVAGDASAITISRSTHVVFTNVSLYDFTIGVNSYHAITSYYSHDIIFQNSYFDNMQGRFFMGVAGADNVFRYNSGNVVSVGNGTGIISWNNDHITGTSSGTVIAGNSFKAVLAGTEALIQTTMAVGARMGGMVVEGNKLVYFLNSTPNTNITFISIGARTGSTVIKNNDAFAIGTFLSDSGGATKSASLGNFLDGVEQ